jgi:methyl-accepting chemotaxis protein
MKYLRNLSTAAKVKALAIMMAVTLAIVGGCGYYASIQLSNSMDNMYQNRLLPIKWVNEVRAYSRTIEGITMELFVTKDKTIIDKSQKEIGARAAEVDKALEAYSKTKLDPYEQERLPKLMDAVKTYRAQRQKAVELALAGNQQAGYDLYNQEAAATIDTINVILKELADYNAAASEKEKVVSENLATNLNRIVLGAIILAVLFSLTAGIGMANMIARPLKTLTKDAKEVAGGNLTIDHVLVNSQDEVGQLSVAFNDMVEHLRMLVKKVIVTAEQVTASSQELTSNAEESAQVATQMAATISELAEGATQQAQDVNATASTVEQMSAGIQQVAANANAVNSMAEKTASSAQEGGKAVEAATEQMHIVEATVAESAAVIAKLGDRSKEIGQIVDTISGIAGQTNLLALNAAIEAARAGEQGRGFAVVAEEVRKLAEQSQEAAKQIASLIGEIQNETQIAVDSMNRGTQEVNKGAQVVNAAGTAFADIVSSINEVSSEVEEISAAIQQMAVGSQQIVSSVRDIERISKDAAEQSQTVSAATQEESASMQEIAAASEALTKLAEELQGLVVKFSV